MRGGFIWKKIYTLIYRCLPIGTRRRKIASLLVYIIKKPKNIIKKLSLRKVLKFFYFLLKDRQQFREKTKNFLIVCGFFTPEPIIKYKIYSSSSRGNLVFPREEQPQVSVIIPVYNQWSYTYSCLCSILDNTRDISYEVIVADDVSSDDTVRIKDVVKNIAVIRNSSNKGFLLNCNNAARYARGKYLLFLNNDTSVLENWLKPLVDLIESDDQIGMAGSKLVYPEGGLQEAGGIIWRDASTWNYGRNEDPSLSEYNYVKEVDYISGACIMIRTSLWQEIGGFDERYAPDYFEDSDLAFEVRKHGYKVMFQPKSIVVHYEGVSHGTSMNSHQLHNLNKFRDKWKEVLENEHDLTGENLFYNRDRSKHKKTILVIDYCVPQFDKDAGSRTTYNYLKLFLKMGFNVKFLDDKYCRCDPYTSFLENMGIEVFYGQWFYDNIEYWLKNKGKYIDYVYLNRPNITEKYIDMVKEQTQAKIFYYGHDLHYLREFRQYQVTKQRQMLDSSEKQKEIEFEIIRKSDVVYYPSSVEIEELKQHFPEKNLRAIPAYIFDKPVPKNDTNWSERKDLLFVGGFSHTPNVDAVLWFVNEIMPSVLPTYPDLKLYIVGSFPPAKVKALNSKTIVVTGYVTDEELEKYYRECRMVIAPLRFGAGVKGKIVEALYHRMPVVTTSVGAEGLPDVEGKLFICNDVKDYVETIIKIYNDVSLLSGVSKKLDDYIVNYFSENSVLNILSKDFEFAGNKQREGDVA